MAAKIIHTSSKNLETGQANQSETSMLGRIVDLYLRRWTTHGQKATLEAEYNRGIQTGKTWREIGAALGQIVKGWGRGR
jgi:hypothetical protein